MQQNLKMMIVLGVNMFVLGSCECLLWSYVVEILCLDTNKKRWVDVDLSLDILVFSLDPKYPLAAESKNDDCVSCNYACPRFLCVASVVICG